MARIRTVKPEIHEDEAMEVLSDSAFRLFIGCITRSDDAGRLLGNPQLLGSKIWPYNPRPPEEVEQLLAELDRAGLVQRYEHDGRQLIFLPGFTANQRIEKPQPSKLPPIDHPDSQIIPGSVGDRSETDPPRKGRERKGEERRGESAIDTADAPLSLLLADLIAQNGSRRPRVGKRWVEAERLLLERDGRDRSEAEQLIRWCQADEFWRSNVLSMPKFREKYDTLRLQAQRGSNGKPAGSLTADLERLEAEKQRLLREEKAAA